MDRGADRKNFLMISSLYVDENSIIIYDMI